MASWISPTIHATFDVFAVTDYNTLANNEIFLYQAPYAMYYNSVSVSLTTGTQTQITLGGTTATNYGFSLSSNNLILPLTGLYCTMFAGQVGTSGGSVTTFVESMVEYNGAIIINGSVTSSDTAAAQSTGSGLFLGTAGATLGLFMKQTSGGTLMTNAVPQNTFIHAFFVGSQ